MAKRKSRYGAILRRIQDVYWITGKILAGRVGVPYGTICNYIYSGFVPREDTHLKILRFLRKVNVSRSAIAALDSVWKKEYERPLRETQYEVRTASRPHPPRRVIRTAFGHILRQILYAYDISISDFVSASGIPRGTFSNWIYMGQYPLPEQFEYLVKFLKRMRIGRDLISRLDKAWTPAVHHQFKKWR